MGEYRRAPRRQVADHIEVLDVMTDVVIGRVGNLSQGGMLLVSHQSLVEDGLYQLRFGLREPGGKERQFNVGAHILWDDDASAPGQHWIGLRFIDIANKDAEYIRHWAERPGARHV